MHDCSMCTVMVNDMVGLLAKMARQGKRVLWVFIATLVAIAFPFIVFFSFLFFFLFLLLYKVINNPFLATS